jgi:hypothetical protein
MDAHPDIPSTANFFSTIESNSRERVAGLYRRAGWEVRECSRTEYEVTCQWADLMIQSQAPVLLWGGVAGLLDHADELLAPLRTANIKFSAEFYGPKPERQLLLELHT